MDPWTAQELVNARTMPLVYGALLVLALLFSNWRAKAVQASVSPLRMFGVVVLAGAFLLALPVINLWFGLAGLLTALSVWLGERRTLPILLLSVSVPLLGWFGIEVCARPAPTGATDSLTRARRHSHRFLQQP